MFINSLSNEERGRELEFMFPDKPDVVITKQITEAHKKYLVGKSVAVDDSECKVNIICQALKQSLEKVNTENKYLLPILTTYIKKQP